jgi:hypothetical protein
VFGLYNTYIIAENLAGNTKAGCKNIGIRPKKSAGISGTQFQYKLFVVIMGEIGGKKGKTALLKI